MLRGAARRGSAETRLISGGLIQPGSFLQDPHQGLVQQLEDGAVTRLVGYGQRLFPHGLIPDGLDEFVAGPRQGARRPAEDADGRAILAVQEPGVVEERDASEAEWNIDEINTGVMVLPAQWLGQALAALDNDNVQGEYYLTDVIGFAVQQGLPIVTVEPA